MKKQLQKWYYVEEDKISPIQFGIPQTRLRLFILGILKKDKNDCPLIKWPKLQNNTKNRRPTTNLEDYLIENPYNPRFLSENKKKNFRLLGRFFKENTKG